MSREKFRWIEQKRSIIQNLKHPSHLERTQAGIGEDYSRLALCETESFGYAETTGICLPDALGCVKTGVIKQYNKLACGGYEPVSLMDTILMPEPDETQMKQLLRELVEFAGSLHVDVVYGDTKIIEAVRKPIVTVTMMGRKKKQVKKLSSAQNDDAKDGSRHRTFAQIRPDMEIVMCGQTGILGTLLRARMRKEELLDRYSEDYLRTAERFDRLLLIKDQGRIAWEEGAVYAHHISGSGVYGALWELAEAGHVGLVVDHAQIPVMQETIEICEFTGEDPYRIDGCGAALFVIPKGDALCDRLYACGYEAAVIGRTTADHDRVLLYGDEKSYLTPV